MNLEDIYRVETVSESIIVNLLLKHGWKLLGVMTDASWDSPNLQTSSSCFAVGATKNAYEKYSLRSAKAERDKHKWDNPFSDDDAPSYFD